MIISTLSHFDFQKIIKKKTLAHFLIKFTLTIEVPDLNTGQTISFRIIQSKMHHQTEHQRYEGSCVVLHLSEWVEILAYYKHPHKLPFLLTLFEYRFSSLLCRNPTPLRIWTTTSNSEKQCAIVELKFKSNSTFALVSWKLRYLHLTLEASSGVDKCLF